MCDTSFLKSKQEFCPEVICVSSSHKNGHMKTSKINTISFRDNLSKDRVHEELINLKEFQKVKS